jgi:phytoene dehydrogenase-like protein
VVLFDTSPGDAVRIAQSEVPAGYARRIRSFRSGPGVFKLDWALGAPIPWKARECARAATVHIGGTFEEIARSEREMGSGIASEQPYVLLAQHSLFDPSRAPAGKHTAWAYCHVPNGCGADMTERIERQVERFAPGFRQIILGRSVLSPANLEEKNANLKGGDITGGANNLGQIFTRPVASLHPYRLGKPGLYICSASAPPGGGVHGMCGYFAAREALRDAGMKEP